MLTKIPKSIPASELRKNLSQYLKDAKKNPVVISTDRGNDARVMIDAETYNKLIEAYEDLSDAEELDRLVKNDSGDRISWDKIKEDNEL